MKNMEGPIIGKHKMMSIQSILCVESNLSSLINFKIANIHKTGTSITRAIINPAHINNDGSTVIII